MARNEATSIGSGKSVIYLPGHLARLHQSLPVGERIKARLSPRPSRAWSAQRAVDLVVGAGFVFDGKCVLRGGRATMTLERLQSLPDSVGPGMSILIVGLNPSPYSADSGIPYGRPGNRFWPAALGSGLVSVDRDPGHALSEHGVGFTDLVRRTTRRADEVSHSEFEEGFARVSRLVKWLKPAIVCFVGLSAFRAVVEKNAAPGLQDQPIGSSPVYVMPHTSGLNAHCRLEDLTKHFAKVRKLAKTGIG